MPYSVMCETSGSFFIRVGVMCGVCFWPNVLCSNEYGYTWCQFSPKPWTQLCFRFECLSLCMHVSEGLPFFMPSLSGQLLASTDYCPSWFIIGMVARQKPTSLWHNLQKGLLGTYRQIVSVSFCSHHHQIVAKTCKRGLFLC